MKELSLNQLRSVSGGDGECYCYGNPVENGEEQRIEFVVEKLERV